MSIARRLLPAFAVCLVLSGAGAAKAQQPAAPSAQQKGPVYVIAHIDLIPKNLEAGTALLKQLIAESVKDGGNVRFEVLQEPSRPNHITIVEVWQDQAAFEAHIAAEHTKQFRDKLNPLIGSPYDDRIHRLLQ